MSADANEKPTKALFHPHMDSNMHPGDHPSPLPAPTFINRSQNEVALSPPLSNPAAWNSSFSGRYPHRAHFQRTQWFSSSSVVPKARPPSGQAGTGSGIDPKNETERWLQPATKFSSTKDLPTEVRAPQSTQPPGKPAFPLPSRPDLADFLPGKLCKLAFASRGDPSRPALSTFLPAV